MTEPGAGARPFHRLTGMLIGGALVGKLLGFVREILMARLLGASIVADSFRGGLTATLLPLALLQGDMVPAILIPLHREWQAEGRAARMFASLTVMFALTALAMMGVVEIMADQWIDLIVGGFTPEAHVLTRRFLEVMALAMPASAVFNCLSAIEISLGRSRITSLRASVQNVGVILGIAATAVTHQPILIAWCFVAAFNITATWGVWSLWQGDVLDVGSVRLSTVWHTARVFLGRLRPLVVQPMSEQASIWVERLMGSGLGIGTIASMDYARTLTESANYLVSQPVGYAVLASGATAHLETRRRMETISRHILCLALPASIFLAMFAPEVVEVVFARGAFTGHAVGLTSRALAGIASGLWATTLAMILIRMLNVAGRNRGAAWIMVAANGLNILFNLAFASRLGALGLGLAEALRGVVVLGGTAWALGCGSVLLRLLGRMAPACLLLIGVEWVIQTEISAVWPRLGFGALAAGITLVALTVCLLPDVIDWLRVRTGFKGRIAKPGSIASKTCVTVEEG